MSDPNHQPVKPTIVQVIGSVLAAAFGVQNSANRERDFAGGSATTYIIAGIIFTIVFIFTILTIVRMVIR
jgi:hypothetical protein